MGNDVSKNSPDVDLYTEIEKRKDWFFECQLRHLNLESFRNVKAELEQHPVFLRDLISETDPSNPPLGSTQIKNQRVYLDSRKPLWTNEEREQRNAFKDISTGTYGNWLDYKQPQKIAGKLDALKKEFELREFGSDTHVLDGLSPYLRDKAYGDNGLPHAISRMSIVQSKPWLIPEIFNFIHEDCTQLTNWIENAENFIKSFENEVLAVTGYPVNDTSRTLDVADEEIYSKLVEGLWDTWKTTNTSKAVKVRFWEEPKPDDKYKFSLNVNIKGSGYKPISKISFKNLLNYWCQCFNNSILEVCVNKPDSDMGLCFIMRTLYLYGTLPEDFRTNDEIKVDRKRALNFEIFDKFFDELTKKMHIDVGKDDFKGKVNKVRWKLKALLKQSESDPRSAAIGFSPIAQEILKQAVLGYKFWLDEPFHAYDYYDSLDEVQDEDKAMGINKARKDTGKGELFSEMEYWSENHYIMFASSEYLAGQLWPEENFQPARDFLKGKDIDNKFGLLSGRQRMERGRARVLKWLNNRLMFGWTEFNSSGYYREHLYALLNLVDFAGDDEVRKKAKIVTDLLLFDLTRFTHKGSMGAAGGRSQFPSKNSGWDNASGDLLEIMLGTRGVFINYSGEVGCCFATSIYKTPEVLLEIGCNPPENSFVDRSRVSITFEEAPKYGIQYSKVSKQRTSIEVGFSPKREKHFKALDNVNKAIADSHPGYEPWMDDNVFWWTMSGYFNKEIARNTLKLIEIFRLQNTGVFKELLAMIEIWIPLVERASHALRGTAIFGLSGAPASILGITPGAGAAKIVGGLGGFLLLDNAIFDVRIIEEGSEDLAIFLDGSTRTRANILTYRNRDIMLSSLQNFRTGQFNFQSNVNQATLNTSVNIFTTAAFAGLDLSSFETGFLSGSLLGSTALGIIGVGAGVVGGILLNEFLVEDEGKFAKHGDGPGWWTGYWALPMVVQHESAAILAYDFNTVQNKLAKIGSHAWFPIDGFDQIVERVSLAYVEENDVFNDLFDMPPSEGVGGKWLFGKIVHKEDPLNHNNNEEGYVGVFSNEEPEWQDKDKDFYKAQIKEKNEKALKKIEDSIEDKLDELEDEATRRNIVGGMQRQIIEGTVLGSLKIRYSHNISKEDWFKLVHDDIAIFLSDKKDLAMTDELINLYIDRHNHQRIWAYPMPVDFFANKDWYVNKKNIWIIQMGSKNEFSSFENFVERVSRARIEIDDVGDMSCTYHIPKPNNSSQALSLKYGDGGKFTLDGAPFQDDFYPRFENPFIRGGRVEWGQREYVIEHNGKSLMHDFSNLEHPERHEEDKPSPANAFLVKGLVIYLKNEDQEMEIFTVATANVMIDCSVVTKDEVVAVGMVKENNYHDAEWIFFDHSSISQPDMTIDIGHHVIPGKETDPDNKWKFTFKLKALMGDRSLKQCTVQPIPSGTFYLRDEHRNTGPVPFSVQLSLWRKWEFYTTGINNGMKPWMIAGQPGNDYFYFDYIDILSFDKNNILRHQKRGLSCEPFIITDLTGKDNEPKPDAHFSLFPYSTRPGHLFLFLINEGVLYVRWLFPKKSWDSQSWINPVATYRPTVKIPGLNIEVPDMKALPVPVPLGLSSRVCAAFINYAEIMPAVYISGADGNFYVTSKWPLDGPYNWRQIKTAPVLTHFQEVPFQIGGNSIFAMDYKRLLWRYSITPGKEDESGSWEQLPLADFSIKSFTVAAFDDKLKVIVVTGTGEVWSIRLTPGAGYNQWQRIGQNINFKTYPDEQVSCASAVTGRLDIFARGFDDKIHTTWWTKETGWEGGHNWVAIDPDAPEFKVSRNGDVKAVSRVKGQIEIFTTSSEQNIWKNWWS